jgi:hypothetical protein
MHLFVVLNGPKSFEGYGAVLCIALVSLSSVPVAQGVKYDTACVLTKGCHPSIQHDSYVYYKGTRLEQVRDVQLRVTQGFYIPGTPVEPELLQRIRQGLLDSPFTKREFKLLGI